MNVKTLLPSFLKTKISYAAIKRMEAKIDVLVYKLYGLSYAEVLVVDGEFGFSGVEYDKILVV